MGRVPLRRSIRREVQQEEFGGSFKQSVLGVHYRILKEIRQVFGFTFRVFYFAENVASVDREAEQQVSTALGIRPCRVDCADAAPIHRLCFCWTNVEIRPLADVESEATLDGSPFGSHLS